MRDEDEILTQIKAWGEGDDRVRAAILTGSRARDDRETDVLSDYDVALYVASLEPFRRDDEWLAPFGPIMARWPARPRSTWSEAWVTRLVLFRDRVRVDFQISDQRAVQAGAYDDGYRVLLDKDGLAADLEAPTYSAHLVSRPSREEYETLVQEFWWDAQYVPKHLWRGELPFAASMLAQSLRDTYLQTMVEWHIGLRHDWRVSTGLRGQWFERYLDPDTWSAFLSTYPCADIEDHWRAFFDTVALFRNLGRTVGTSLGYRYPEELDREMTAYFTWIRSGGADGAHGGAFGTVAGLAGAPH